MGIVLLTDVGDGDSPTEVIVGSHLDVPDRLAPFGAEGMRFLRVVGSLPSSTFDRPSAFLTGAAGDVYLCHPFLVHRGGGPHRGRGLRVIATPHLDLDVPFALDPADASPVEQAILRGLSVPAGDPAPPPG
jgi:hypothetical protein